MLLSNWPVAYGADDNDIKRTMEVCLFIYVCIDFWYIYWSNCFWSPLVTSCWINHRPYVKKKKSRFKLLLSIYNNLTFFSYNFRVFLKESTWRMYVGSMCVSQRKTSGRQRKAWCDEGEGTRWWAITETVWYEEEERDQRHLLISNLWPLFISAPACLLSQTSMDGQAKHTHTQSSP